MQRPFTDFNDWLPSLSAKGVIHVREKHEIGKGAPRKEAQIAGRYLDPVSGRLSEISNDEYYRAPVDTWLKGRADFIYSGQKPGHYTVEIADLDASQEIVQRYPGGEPGWKEYKIWEPTCFRKSSTYTNLPAKY
jgi:hypothetical protein